MTKSTLPARASFACLLALTALHAQQPANNARSSADDAAHMKNSVGATLKASDLIGMKLENAQRQKIGKVEDVAIDLQSGRVVQLILSTGGLLSIGERHVAVPPGQVHYGAKDQPLHFDITPEKLKAAPEFEMSRWTEYYQSDHAKDSDRYFGVEPSLESNRARREVGATATRMGHVQRATKLMGLQVRNLQDEKIGDVDNLIIDLPAGRVVAVIVSSGGFLGLGDALSVVPPGALQSTGNRDRLTLDTTKEALRDAPRFKANEWPDFAQADYTAGVYRAYKQEPYVRGAGSRAVDGHNTARDSRDRGDRAPQSNAPDNSARNTRDRDDRTLTSGDQGGNTTDVKITQEIRKAVTATDDFSVNAKNVKIITVGGRVTLRGPVKTAQEKSRIAAMAARIAGAANVDDQLEVTAR